MVIHILMALLVFHPFCEVLTMGRFALDFLFRVLSTNLNAIVVADLGDQQFKERTTAQSMNQNQVHIYKKRWSDGAKLVQLV